MHTHIYLDARRTPSKPHINWVVCRDISNFKKAFIDWYDIACIRNDLKQDLLISLDSVLSNNETGYDTIRWVSRFLLDHCRELMVTKIKIKVHGEWGKDKDNIEIYWDRFYYGL